MKFIPPTLKTTRAEQGFTLIELSIVLVIIGLIVGGVLVGQDLIKAAETRATISQIEKYNSAVNTFRNKYNGLPGDLVNANSTFGFVGGAGGTGDRDGNGFIEGCAALAVAYGCETAYFWADLSTAGFLDASLTANGASGANKVGLLNLTSSSLLAASIPQAKLGKGNWVAVFYNGGYNWFGLGAISAASGIYTITAAGLTPNQAFNIDKKVDDGAPLTGIVEALTTAANGTATSTYYPTASASSTACAATSTSYNLLTAYGDTPLCGIEMRFN